MSIRLINSNGTFSPIKIEDLIYDLERVCSTYSLLISDKDLKDSAPQDRSVFVNSDEIFLIEIVGFDSLSQLKVDSVITRQRDGDRYVYYSSVSGYLGIRDGYLTVLNPVIINNSRLKMFYIYIPLGVNQNILEDNLRCYLEIENLDLKKTHKILIREAVEPIPSVDSYLEWEVVRSEHPPLLENGKIDYKSWNPFLEVKADELIVKKHLKVDGSPGVDVLGSSISVTVPSDIEITTDENIYMEKGYGVELYKAKTPGLLIINNNHLSLSENLIIESDVDYQTGNVSFSCDVYVHGDVKSGFSIKCGGNLSIKGTVESGVSIDVKGDCHISGGILGKDTNVTIGGNLEVEYIQDSSVRVEGDITVINSIYHADVFSGSFCTVLGKKIRNINHGSVVGGSLTSMEGLELHSVGALASRAEISCGIDYDLKKKVAQLREVVPVLTSSIIKRQKHLNLNNMDQMNHLEREILKNELLELKRLITRKSELEQRLKEMSLNVVSKNLNSVKINIKSFIMEDNKISIGESFTYVKKRSSKVCYKLVNGIIGHSL